LVVRVHAPDMVNGIDVHLGDHQVDIVEPSVYGPSRVTRGESIGGVT